MRMNRMLELKRIAFLVLSMAIIIVGLWFTTTISSSAEENQKEKIEVAGEQYSLLESAARENGYEVFVEASEIPFDGSKITEYQFSMKQDDQSHYSTFSVAEYAGDVVSIMGDQDFTKVQQLTDQSMYKIVDGNVYVKADLLPRLFQ